MGARVYPNLSKGKEMTTATICKGVFGSVLLGYPCPKCGNKKLQITKPDHWVSKSVVTVICNPGCGWQKDASLNEKPVIVPPMEVYCRLCGSNPKDNPHQWEVAKIIKSQTRCDNCFGK